MCPAIKHLPTPLSLRELQVRANALCGTTIGELARALGAVVPGESRRAKGFVGALVEAALGADPEAFDRPDFPELGVELKTIPVTATFKPRESTFCCSITMATADREDWLTSRLRQRLAQVLWVPVVVASRGIVAAGRLDRPRLWRPSAHEEAMLKADWEDLMGAIGMGAAPSARVGQVLQVRPKAQTSRVRTLAPGADGPCRSLPLGFYLRPRFTETILIGRA